MASLGSRATGPAPIGKEGRRAANKAGGIAELPPLATAASDCLLPNYWFRLPVIPKGSFFSILSICTAFTGTKNDKVRKMARNFRQPPTMWLLRGCRGSHT
jgi:hypothetical protein